MWIIVQLAVCFGLIAVITDNALLGALLGLALTVNIGRGVYLSQHSLHKLNQTLTFKPHRLFPFDPINRLLNSINEFGQRDVGSLREELLQQTRSVAAQEERNRMARELHDSIKQQLFSINISSGAAAVQLEQNPTKAVAALEDVRLSVKAAMAEMNALLQQLSPAPLEKVGLEQAIRDQAEALAYRTGAEVSVEVDTFPTDASLRTGTQDALFRIVQEALSNVARHARAKHVQVSLRVVEEHIQLVIADDGQGFAKKSSGMGLTNMHERVQALDGHITIQSKPGQGTTVYASIPFNSDLQEEIMIDHTVNRVFFVGLMGGLLLLAILFVPLYFIVPSFYIPDWNSIEFQDLWAMSILATLGAFGILLGSGWIGARFGRASTIAQRLTFGAVAGCVSATVAYLGIGSAAMSVIGAQNIIEYGYQPAANDDHMMSLLYESVGGILIWGHIGLWVVFILGIGIGALGGLLHRNQPNELDSQALRSSRNQVLSWSIVSAGLNLPVGYLAYATLFETIRDDADQYEISQWAMLGSLLAIVTMFAIFMIPLVLALWFHRQDFRAGHYLDAFYGGTSAGAVAVIASWFMLSGETLSLNTILGSVIWGIGMLLLGSARRTAQTEMVKAQAHKMRLLIILASFFLITPLIILIFWGWTSMLFTNLALIAGMFGGELLKSQKRILWSGVGMISLVSFGFMAGGLPLFASIGLFSLAGILVRDIVVVFQDSKDEPIVFVNKSVWESHLGSLLGSTTVLVINSALVVITALPLVLIVVGVLPVLIPNDNETTYESSTTMLETVQAFYLIQAQSILIMFFVGLGIMGIVTLVMYAVRRWQKRSSLRQKGLVYDTSRVSG